MQPLPKEYKFAEIERKWQQKWEELGVYRFDWNDTKRVPFTIDTPPPYPSGELHMGNVLNWTYFDIVARYKRMRGYNVLFPQGWDCHGLSIEIQVEKENKIRKRDVPPDQFRKWCEQLVERYIAMMKEGILKLGCSIDWTTEYRTMDPDYWRRTQLSFILLHKKGYMYQGTHPVNWCPRCETAIADAEVDYEKREGTLYYIRFPLEGSNEYLLVATSRPEFIPACVAVEVNPEDERFKMYIGRKIIVPVVNRTVAIIGDEAVDPCFGTGVVQICTYGDKEDVKTVMKHKLPVITLLTENGRITENGGKYAGLTVNQARKAIVEDLAAAGLLEKSEKITQEVGVCDRCKSHVEILERKQWFMKTRVLTDLVEKTANEVVWYPDYMKARLIDWAKSLDWDWVISRQRVFATPVPVWYCKNCNEIILAQEDWVPIDPKLESPRIDKCPKCGSRGFTPESDVFDTWMDSSITCAVHAGWPDREDWRRLFPADIHPSGIDIIRTWAYYLMVRHLALFNETPYKSCLINGMVLGSDGRKMSKSLKNYVAAPEVLDKYGSDATRQWAAGGGATGSDIPFRWPDVEYGRRFLVKLWNVSSFASKLLTDYVPAESGAPGLQVLDRWILSKAEKLTRTVTEAMEKCQFNIAVEAIRNFTWHVFCDSYVEAVKDRLYKPEAHGDSKRLAAQQTLYDVLYRILQLLAPITPHLTEEIYQAMYAEHKGFKSLQVSPWPEFNAAVVDEHAEKRGDLIVALIGEVRREKAEKRMPLNTQIKRLTVYAGDHSAAEAIADAESDIIGACKVESLTVLPEEGVGRDIAQYPSVHFIAEYAEEAKK
ncbi:MAG: valine--tRNA ligase [Candidatus Bathyarchaeota archaeon]|nr:valine--tRNA ligase [Candidatus Bathyarchaeota archaeon]